MRRGGGNGWSLHWGQPMRRQEVCTFNMKLTSKMYSIIYYMLPLKCNWVNTIRWLQGDASALIWLEYLEYLHRFYFFFTHLSLYYTVLLWISLPSMPDIFVQSFSHLKDKHNADKALQILKRIATLVKPIMRKRNWVLKVLAEFFPDNPNLLGK